MEQEDYLETIYDLNKKFGYVRISDIARELNISKPSVTQMMQRLERDGCIFYKPYAPLKLTLKGKNIGKKVSERHQVLAEFFTILNIPSSIQKKDIHGIEHFLSTLTLKKFRDVSKFLKDHYYRN